MARADIPPRVDPALPLVERTRRLLASFDGEVKDYAFNDGGDGTTYAEWFADLLDEWLAAVGGGSSGAHPYCTTHDQPLDWCSHA